MDEGNVSSSSVSTPRCADASAGTVGSASGSVTCATGVSISGSVGAPETSSISACSWGGVVSVASWSPTPPLLEPEDESGITEGQLVAVGDLAWLRDALSEGCIGGTLDE